MSNFNYMDNVPVKISENYRPLPLVYQLPQAISHKLDLDPNHYSTAQQYKYDFQLEHILLAKLPEWRHLRQREKELRRERMVKREEQRQRLLQQQQKQLLGAVSYPSTEDLSSSSSEANEIEQNENKSATDLEKQQLPSLCKTNNFYNILQPTILMPSSLEQSPANGYLPMKTEHVNLGNSFNYQDFEGSSSPFDEIELKTINDLDILAQVLHNTQLKTENKPNETHSATEKFIAESPNNITNETHIPNSNICEVNSITTNLPLTINSVNIETTAMQTVDKTLEQQESATFSGVDSQNMLNDTHELNGKMESTMNLCSYKRDDNKHNATINYQIGSVPDIINVLKNEVLKSERNCYVRKPDQQLTSVEKIQATDENPSKSTTEASSLNFASVDFDKLDKNIKQMVINISSMGFSLEQVSRIALLYGADEKKIIEHLLSLNELSAFGFTEEHISDALLKCENNKEKALELLIS